MISGYLKFSKQHKCYYVTIKNGDVEVYSKHFDDYQEASNAMTLQLNYFNELEYTKEIDYFRNPAYLSQVKRGIYG